VLLFEDVDVGVAELLGSLSGLEEWQDCGWHRLEDRADGSLPLDSLSFHSIATGFAVQNLRQEQTNPIESCKANKNGEVEMSSRTEILVLIEQNPGGLEK
jgi:hypothetical protein